MQDHDIMQWESEGGRVDDDPRPTTQSPLLRQFAEYLETKYQSERKVS